MGLIDTIFGTAVSGYITFKLTNAALERVFFSRTAAASNVSKNAMLSGTLKQQLRIFKDESGKNDPLESSDFQLQIMYDKP